MAKSRRRSLRISLTPCSLDVSSDEEDLNELSFYDGPPWHPPNVICDQLNESGIRSNGNPVQPRIVENVVKLLEEECTVPFIARYRKEQTGNMEAAVIREIKSSLEELKVVQEKTKSHLGKLGKEKKLTKELRESFCNSHSMIELEQLFAPFKAGSKTTLAERARRTGLEPAAEKLLGETAGLFNIQSFIHPDTEGCRTAAEVEKGVQHIIAEVVSKDKTTVDYLRSCVKDMKDQIFLSVSKAGQARKKTKKEQQVDYEKFQTYFDGKFSINTIKPHQVLAINRGEEFKALTVKVTLPDRLTKQFINWCKAKWCSHTQPNSYSSKIMCMAVDDAYNRLMSPMILREIRSTLNKTAEKASIEVFTQNLHRLLLTPPVKGRVILGVDPGFKNGCKLAMISATGEILTTSVSLMHTGNKYYERNKMIDLIQTFKCETIGIGNGTACRETEEFFSEVIRSGSLQPLHVQYCIVNEDGASIYSVSPEAEKEMPNLDPNIRSAVSIARRLQDPLAELVKIDPKHIGVGMYQHDVPERLLKAALGDVVEESVSFVGVDLNICSEVLLKWVSGISACLAKKIISHRQRFGAFINRQMLLDVKGLGPKTFKQCAGFVRINPTGGAEDTNLDEVIVISTSEDEVDVKPLKRKRAKTTAGPSKRRKKSDEQEPLDSTWIHPEAYEETRQLLKMAFASGRDIGSESIRGKLDNLIKSRGNASLAGSIGVGEPTLDLIINGLKQPTNYDIRVEFDKPLFKQNIMSIDQIIPGMQLTGRVTNAVHFGVFVDIGVKDKGLCHRSHMLHHILKGKVLGPGDKVEVVVISKRLTDSGKWNFSLRLVGVS
ncbi:S1 RNA-binding domain-containing protein 1 [Strongylocentrotus purpuratus]|uniref:S1 motif domain-containing protein n=1 Tax=Strongylocentrotus purpuratus TaxID=7668 RepID=A0A7M7PN33_STRPU|nr:S1 RNA-binding domain-containing protein 1 [Strongylocentrotus purpuratus]